MKQIKGTLYDTNCINEIAAIKIVERKEALKHCYRIAKLHGVERARNMLEALMFATVISISAYTFIGDFLAEQELKGWY